MDEVFIPIVPTLPMRLFIAVEIPDQAKDRIQSLIRQLSEVRPDVKWVEYRNLHLTLKFLGNVREDAVNNVVKIAQNVASSTNPFTIALQGMGVFGSPPQVLWMDMHPKHHILDLMKGLNHALDYIHKDTQPPTAHLTIGRFRTLQHAGMLRKKMETRSGVNVGEFEVSTMVLKKSVLGANGPEYTDIKTFSLGSV